MITEETRVLVTLIRHQRHVAHLLRELARELDRRAELHDLSVLELDEFEGRVNIQNIVRTYPYDSPEYRASLKGETSLQLHYQRNTHHPEHYPGGVSDMSLIDFIEAACDWLGASRTYKNTSFRDGIPEQVKRFKLEQQHLFLVDLIGKWFGE